MAIKSSTGGRLGEHVSYVPLYQGERAKLDEALARGEDYPDVARIEIKLVSKRELDRLSAERLTFGRTVRLQKGDKTAYLEAAREVVEACVGKVENVSDAAGEPITDGKGLVERGCAELCEEVDRAVRDHNALSDGVRKPSSSRPGSP